jgi:hypothetical protein
VKTKPKLTYIDGYWLDAGPHWHEFTPAERSNILNGVGPESWPRFIRWLFDLLPFLKPASRPHDIDFHVGGDAKARRAANRRFLANTYRVAKMRFGCGFWHGLVSGKAIRWTLTMLWLGAAWLALAVGSSRHWTHRTTA